MLAYITACLHQYLCLYFGQNHCVSMQYLYLYVDLHHRVSKSVPLSVCWLTLLPIYVSISCYILVYITACLHQYLLMYVSLHHCVSTSIHAFTIYLSVYATHVTHMLICVSVRHYVCPHPCWLRCMYIYIYIATWVGDILFKKLIASFCVRKQWVFTPALHAVSRIIPHQILRFSYIGCAKVWRQ